MKLSEITTNNIDLIRDEDFNGFALCKTSPNMPIFTFISEPEYLSYLKTNKDIKCILTTKELSLSIPESYGLCISSSPKNDFFFLHNNLSENNNYKRKELPTEIGKNCSISNLASISKTNVIIGDNVIIEDFVSIQKNVTIGNNTIIRTGSIIGGQGFEYKNIDNKLTRINHIGGVIIGNDVEIFHNVCITAAIFPWDNTIIGNQTKIDNLVHIPHCCKIGNRNLITGGVIFCGSAITDDDVFIGPNATISHIKINKSGNVSLGSVVISDVPENKKVSGNFAVEHFKFLKIFNKLFMNNTPPPPHKIIIYFVIYFYFINTEINYD